MTLNIEALSEVIVENIINQIEDRLIKDICDPIARKIVADVQQEEEKTEMILAVKNYMDRNILSYLLENIVYLTEKQEEIDHKNFLADQKAKKLLH